MLVELLKAAMTCRYEKTSFFFKSSDAFERERGFFFKSFENISMRKGIFYKSSDAFVDFVHLRCQKKF